jgi:sec-independent protein translocase protein TatB
MIDLGLSKLAVIGVVALVVIGPERLPKVARMAGTLFGRAQRYINDVKAEVSREIEIEELRQMQKEMQSAASDVEQTIAKNLSEVESGVTAAWEGDPMSGPGLSNPLVTPAAERHLAAKARDFRKKKVRTSAMPDWYRKQSGTRARIMSGAARVAKYRTHGRSGKTSFFS